MHEQTESALVKQLEKLCSSVLIQRMRELGDSRGDLQAALKDDFLPLKSNILWPSHESGEIPCGLKILT